MTGQDVADDEPVPAVHVCTDLALLDAAGAVIAEYGYSGLTLSRLAAAAGTSRMTLHRRGITVAGVVAGLSLRAADELRLALFPVLASTGSGAERLERALEMLCVIADRHLPLLAGLFADDAGVFHAEPDAHGALPTDEVFVAPFARLLADGAADGSLRVPGDVTEAATVLFNTFGWGYVQLRHAQRWDRARARDGVLTLVMRGLSAGTQPNRTVTQ